MADYIAVETGKQSVGYLIANGNVYPAASGVSTLLDIPQGTYSYGGPVSLSADQYYSMTDAANRKEATKKHAADFRKFHIGTGPGGTGNIPDKRRPRQPRTGIEFHYDGGNPGTAGCIGYQDNAAKDALIADPNKTVFVHYAKTMEEVKAIVECQIGPVDWSKVKAPRGGGGGGGSGTHSKTRKGNKVKKANKTVLLGPKLRHAAHRQALLEGGAQIAAASRTVFVGPDRLGVARVDDPTTDGSPIADGEASILVG